MALRSRVSGHHESAASSLSSPRQEELEYPHTPARVAGELRVTEAGIEIVDDDGWLAVLLGLTGHFAAVEYFEQFGYVIPSTHQRERSNGEASDRSDILAVFGSFNASKMLELLLSGMSVSSWTSELTMTRCGVTLN